MALTKINSSVIANNTIAVGNIADNSVDATKIASNSILTRHIDDNQIGIDQLNVSDGSNGQFLKTNGSGTLSFATVSSAADDITTGDAAVTIGTSSGTITLDAASTVKLDAGNDEIHLLGSGTEFGKLFASSSNFYINNPTQDKDIIFSGNSGGSTISPLILDMSANRIAAGTTTARTKFHIQGGSESTYTGAGPSDILRVSQSTAGAWIASDFDGAFAYMGNDNSTTAKFAAYNYATSAEMNMILGQDRMYIKSDGNVGIGTTSPNDKLHIKIGTNLNWQFGYPNSSVTTLAALNDAESAYVDARVDALGLDLNTQSGGDITTGTGTTRQHYATDNGSNKRYTAPLNPKIAQVGLQGYWDPTKATDGTDFSPSTHGNGNQDLTLGSGVTHVTNSNRAVWQFDGTSNASMYGNPNLSASKSCSFSLWVYFNNVNSLSGGYQLNGIQIGNHYMYIGVVQGSNDNASMYGYIGQGTNIVHGSSGANENAYINSDEWVYLTIQAGHGSSDVTSRSNGRAECYLNGALVTRVNSIALPTVAANGSSSFYLGRVQGGYYLDGYIGPAVLYERTLHQWEILENMRVHADMYMS